MILDIVMVSAANRYPPRIKSGGRLSPENALDLRLEACDQALDPLRNRAPIRQPVARKAHRDVGAADPPLVQAHRRVQARQPRAGEEKIVRAQRVAGYVLAPLGGA